MTVEALLGFARASGSLLLGETACRHGLAKGRALAVLLARDASERKQRNIEGLARQAGALLLRWGTVQSLSAAVGHPGPLAVVGITKESFVSVLRSLLEPPEAPASAPEEQA